MSMANKSLKRYYYVSAVCWCMHVVPDVYVNGIILQKTCYDLLVVISLIFITV